MLSFCHHSSYSFVMADAGLDTRSVQDEQALLERAKSDPRAVGEIYDLYADRLYGFLLKRCGHRETAEDLVSKIFTRFIENLPNIKWQGVSIGAYLYRSASNALVDHWRSASVRLDTDIDEDWDPPSEQSAPSWHAELNLEREKILEVMKHLSPRDQQIIDLRFFAGLDPEEIGKQMDISSNHASVLIYRAVGRLRTNYLAQYE